MSIKKVFRSHKQTNFIKDGEHMFFMNTYFITDNKKQIALIEKEIELGHPMFYVDPNQAEIDTEKEEAIAKVMEEAKVKYLDGLKKAEDTEGNVSTTETEKLTPASSARLDALMQRSGS
jgi:hypothetical protein